MIKKADFEEFVLRWAYAWAHCINFTPA